MSFTPFVLSVLPVHYHWWISIGVPSMNSSSVLLSLPLDFPSVWTRQFHGQGAAKEIPCPMKECSWFCCHSIFLGESRDNNILCISSFQHWKYCGSKFRGLFSCQVNQVFDCHVVISFQRGLLVNEMVFHGLDTLQLTQEKEKSSVDQCFTGCFLRVQMINFGFYL